MTAATPRLTPADTKTRILDAAEALFVAGGFDAMSMRQITTTASVNLAAVNYHFGSKDALIQAVLARQLDPLNVPADRGLHALKLNLTGLGRGTLVLRNTTGRSNAWAWTVWRDVAILPVSSTSPTGQPILTGSNHVIMRHAHFAAAPLSIQSANPLLAVDVAVGWVCRARDLLMSGRRRRRYPDQPGRW